MIPSFQGNTSSLYSVTDMMDLMFIKQNCLDGILLLLF